MDNKKTNQSAGNEWLYLQQQMLDSWLKAMDQAGAAKKPATNPMVEGMTQWWKTVSGALPEGSNKFVNKLMEQGRIYYILGEQFIALLDILNDVNRTSGNWQQTLTDQFEEMKKQFVTVNKDAGDTLHGVLGTWQQLPMDTMQRTFSFSSIMPGDFLQDMKPDHLEKVTDKFLSIPGVGYTREHQEQIQEGLRLFNEYQKVSQEYNVAMSQVCIRAFDAMREKIIDMAEKGEEITSLRQIYDIWIDCNEDAYAGYVYTDEYSKLYGRLTNSLMAVKHYGKNSVDEFLSALSMPTHRTMNTMQKRQQEIRRDQKNCNLAMERLQQEIINLKKKVNTGNGSSMTDSSSGQTARKRKKKKKKTAKSVSATAGKRLTRRKTGKKPAGKSAAKSGATRKSRGKKSGRAGPNKIVIKI